MLLLISPGGNYLRVHNVKVGVIKCSYLSAKF